MAINKRLIRTNDEGGGVAASFNTVLYTGNGGTQSVTGVGFQPDLVWIKNREAATDHLLSNSISGAGKHLRSNTTGAEYTSSGFSSFNIDGFSLSSSSSFWNQSGIDYVAWSWKAGGAAVTNTDGTITSQVSANTEAGFSIVSYTGNSTNGATVGHGLGVEPSMVIFKNRSITSNWAVYSKQVGVDYTLFLNSTDAKISVSNKFAGTNSSVIGLNSAGDVNSNSIIAYCFAEVAGFSKFGSYTGTGVTDNFVSTSVNGDAGFEPAFLLVKQSSSPRNWYIVDNKRNPSNPKNRLLMPNLSDAEFNGVGDVYFDFNSNGFTVTAAAGVAVNQLNETYIYMAFANQF